MSASRVSLIVLGLLAAALWSQSANRPKARAEQQNAAGNANSALAADQDNKGKEKKRRGKFTIGKETTYVTEPVDKDGYIDYARALNQRLREGVTPENNANVLLWQALGPHPEGASMPSEFFQWMGIQAPPEKGEYFIDLRGYMKNRLKIDPEGKEAKNMYQWLDRLLDLPMAAKERRDFASWLEANEKPLALVVEATKRPQYFSPHVPDKTEKGSSGLIGTRLPAVQKCRGLADALYARAMLRLSQGNYDDAWQDLLACHRLGRLVGRGAGLIEGLVGLAIDGLAGVGDIDFLDRTHADAKRMESCLRDLQKLPPLPDIADKVNLSARFLHLDAVMMVDRQGIHAFEGLSGQPKSSNLLEELGGDLILAGIDWDPALRNINHLYDRMTSIARKTDRASREKDWERINADLKAIKEKMDSGELAQTIVDDSLSAESRGKAVGDILICLLTPAVQRLLDSADRLKQVQDNLCLGFALARYHCDHGRYPKNLDELAPRYVPQIPQDSFSGKPLIYRPSERGFVLYSVGINGKDDGGRGYGDDPRGDDLVVRIPLSERRGK